MLDTSMLAFLAAPFVASLILTGIHAYLGVHVVERGVIFVDLSLAQIAAFGATIAMLTPLAGDPHAPAVYWISLAFTFLGAFVFSTIRSKRARIPQEAIIGICYAVASAAAILAMSKATSESEHLKDMLVGNILAVSWPEVRQDGAAVRRSARSTTFSGRSSWRSRWITRRPRRPALPCASGIFSSTPRLDSWSLRRCRSRACCWCFAI